MPSFQLELQLLIKVAILKASQKDSDIPHLNSIIHMVVKLVDYPPNLTDFRLKLPHFRAVIIFHVLCLQFEVLVILLPKLIVLRVHGDKFLREISN